jgi:hypothetical protein
VLGHSTITLTMDTYGHLYDSVLGDTADKIDALLEARRWRDRSEHRPQDVSLAVEGSLRPWRNTEISWN